MRFPQQCRFSLPAYIAVVVLLACLIWGGLSLQKSFNSSAELSLFNGKWASSFEARFDKNLKHHSSSLFFWNKLNYKLFKEGKDGVLIGEDGWLFTTEEFDYRKGFEQNIEGNFNYITSVKDVLDRANVELIVVPIPSKARVLENKLGKYELPAYRKYIYGQFLAHLLTNKIRSFDLFSKIDEPEIFFLKTDTHWSSAGAELAAENVSELITKNLLRSYKQKYRVERKSKQSLEGDLTRYAVKSFENISVVELMGGGFDDLFGDIHIPVTLVGTSYSANKNWGFDSWLKYHLQADVLNMADEGLGPFEVMNSYLKSDEYQSIKPKLIVWEIPERYLPVKFEKNTK